MYPPLIPSTRSWNMKATRSSGSSFQRGSLQLWTFFTIILKIKLQIDLIAAALLPLFVIYSSKDLRQSLEKVFIRTHTSRVVVIATRGSTMTRQTELWYNRQWRAPRPAGDGPSKINPFTRPSTHGASHQWHHYYRSFQTYYPWCHSSWCQFPSVAGT